jgi:RNA polymerase sigma-70 factor, ECF subfamily
MTRGSLNFLELSGLPAQYSAEGGPLKRPGALEDLNDHQLLRLGRSGDEKAFLALYHRRGQSVFRFALHMSGSREVAEEVVQEVFLALLDGRAAVDEDRGPLEGYLIGMARNRVHSVTRDARRFKCIEDHETVPEAGSSSPNNELRTLRKAILALPERYRAVTVLCDLEELSYADAAQRLGCNIGTVRSRLHRARAILESKLRGKKQCPVSTVR